MTNVAEWVLQAWKDITPICIINGFRNAEIETPLSIGTECNNSENEIENDLPYEIAEQFISNTEDDQFEGFSDDDCICSCEINFVVIAKTLFGNRIYVIFIIKY